MECPRCKLELASTDPYRGADAQHRRAQALHTITHAAGVEIDQCQGCGGVFLDEGELRKIQDAAGRTKSSDITPSHIQRVYARGRDRAKYGDNPPTLTCPACSGEMAPRDWGYGSEVTIDTCLECLGVWLDYTELETLEELYR
ncbi:MAG TPA: zf-TFIIB domain-containing protein [Polyangium sp.]|nr:zf-TFIIB domain-containing protein [Polyangium sp.]